MNRFIDVGGNYPVTDFQTPRWFSIFKQQWWSSLILYVLEMFTDDLMRLGLYEAVRATCFGININIPTFYAILEMYCPTSGIFFTLVDKLRMVLHEMCKVSHLPMGSFLYEEYFSCAEELAQLEKKEPVLYEIY